MSSPGGRARQGADRTPFAATRGRSGREQLQLTHAPRRGLHWKRRDATACVWVLDKPVAQAALIVMAVSAPRALLYLAAEWGQPVNGSLGSEMHEWRAMRPPS